jgi:hypothetical protein
VRSWTGRNNKFRGSSTGRNSALQGTERGPCGWGTGVRGGLLLRSGQQVGGLFPQAMGNTGGLGRDDEVYFTVLKILNLGHWDSWEPEWRREGEQWSGRCQA